MKLHPLVLIAAFVATAIISYQVGVRRDSVSEGKLASSGESGDGSSGQIVYGETSAAAPGLGTLNRSVESISPKTAQGQVSADDPIFATLDAVIAVSADPTQRTAEFGKLLTQLTAENAQSVVERMKELPYTRTRGEQMRYLYYTWASLDGATAAEFAGEMETGRSKAYHFSSIAKGWASKDPAAARDWLENELEIPPIGSGSREGYYYWTSLISGMSISDPAAADRFVIDLAAESDGDRGSREAIQGYTQTLLESKLQTGLTEGMNWARDLPSGAIRERALKGVARSYARTDLEGAARWVEGLGADADAADAIQEVAEEMAERDVNASLEWAQKLPESNRPGAMREVLSEWASEDSLAASQYLDTLQAGDERDQAVAGFSGRVAREDPEGAATWANTIVDDDLRTRMVSESLQNWYRQDRDAAQAWRTTNLPEDFKLQGGNRMDQWRGRGGKGG